MSPEGDEQGQRCKLFTRRTREKQKLALLID